MQSIQRRVIPNSNVVYADLDGEAVLLNIETGTYYGLDAVGTRIWQLLSDGSQLEAVFDTLLGEYDVPPDELRVDLTAFIDTLVAKGLA